MTAEIVDRLKFELDRYLEALGIQECMDIVKNGRYLMYGMVIGLMCHGCGVCVRVSSKLNALSVFVGSMAQN